MASVRAHGVAQNAGCFEPSRKVRQEVLKYEGFRAFYFVCVEAFAANDGYEFMVGYYSWTKV